jgi:hypothetical protein
MHGVHIDQATPADVRRLLDIRHAAFSSQAPSAYSPAQVETLLGEPAENQLREMISNRQLFVVRADGTVVGLAGWPRLFTPRSRVLWSRG